MTWPRFIVYTRPKKKCNNNNNNKFHDLTNNYWGFGNCDNELKRIWQAGPEPGCRYVVENMSSWNSMNYLEST